MRGEYSDFGEPTTQVALRLPESLVAAIDAKRGKASRATYVAIMLSAAISPPKVHKPVVEERTNTCSHPKKRRGASGLLVCEDCGKVMM